MLFRARQGACIHFSEKLDVTRALESMRDEYTYFNPGPGLARFGLPKSRCT